VKRMLQIISPILIGVLMVIDLILFIRAHFKNLFIDMVYNGLWCIILLLLLRL